MVEAQPAPATSTPTESVNFAESGIGSIFDALGDEAPANDTEPAPPPTEGEAAEQEPANDNEQPAAAASDDDVFSEEALSTKEGIDAARARLHDLKKKSHDGYLGLKKYEKKLARRHEKLQSSVEQFVGEKRNHELLIGNVRSNLQGLHSGDPEQMLTALGNLTGQDGLKAFEQLASRLVHKGKPPLDPQVQALLDQQQKQIEQMNQRYENERVQAHVQHLDHQIQTHAQNISQMITADTSLPHLNRILTDEPAETVEYLIDRITKVNGQIPAHQLFRSIEQQLAKAYGAAPQGDGGTSATQKKAGAAVQRSPGQSIGPRAAAASHSRQPTEEESLRALANDPHFMSSLGF